MPAPRDIGREHANLAVGDLARRTRILPSDTARGLALLQETGLVNYQHGALIRQVLDNILAHDVAQRIGIPAAPPQDRLLPPGAGVTGRFRPHPARLASLLPQQPITKQNRRGRHPPSPPTTNSPAEAATRSCVNSGRIRAFTSRNDAAHSSSVSSIDAPLIHPLPTIREKIGTSHPKCNCRVSVSASGPEPVAYTPPAII